METIQEAGDKTTSMPGVLPEADLFSVVRPHQQKTETEVAAAVDGLHGRSSSLNVHLARKASMRMRQWVKRSYTRPSTATTSEVSASESFKAHIKHLGGGRLEEVVAEGPANNTTLLAPAPRRAHKSRAGSPDSRLTQWLDFYPESSETSKSRAHTFPAPLPSEKRTSQRQRQRSGSNSSLRPAPLRVPSSERRAGSSSGSTPPKPLTRKDSKWKPLPLLPAQPVIPKRTEADTVLNPQAGIKAGPKNDERESDAATSLASHAKPSLEQDDLGLLPMITFGTPPPTPDSSTGGAAKTHPGTDKGKAKDIGGRPLAESSNDGARKTRETRQARHETADEGVRHTRQERIWLHVNYRGEARFLKAWGLDITRTADRAEGLAILRDLMAAEKQEGDAEGSPTAV